MRKQSTDNQQTHPYPPNAFKRDKKLQRNYNSQQFQLQHFDKSHQDIELKKSSSHHNILNNDQLKQSLNQLSDDQQSFLSQNDQLQKQADDIVNQLRQKQQNDKANNKMVVGGGFSFDITQFFKFQKKKKLDSKDGDIFQQISGSMLAWLILLYSVCNSAMIPSWIMNIPASKLLRISWRFLMQTVMIFPFVLYQRRVGNQQVKYQYTFSHIIKPVHLKKVYISSIATSIWFTFILTVFEWSFVSHGLVLGSLSNFFLSIHRSITKTEHDLQSGGRYCVILGILLVLYDAYRFDPSKVGPEQHNVVNPFYLHRQWWQRVLADLVALCVSFVMSKFSRYTSDMKSHYPPYLSMLLVNFFMTVNMAMSAYFFNGLTFDWDSRFGWFSIFSQVHFAGFMYMSIVLCFGMFVSYVLISKLFSDPILPALAMTLDPVIGTLLLQWAGIQMMPYAYSFMGYSFIIPGMLLILVGQCLYQRSKAISNEEDEKKKRIEIIKMIKEMKAVKSIDQKKIRMQKVKTIRNDMSGSVSEKMIEEIEMKRMGPVSSLIEPLIQKDGENERNIKSNYDMVNLSPNRSSRT